MTLLRKLLALSLVLGLTLPSFAWDSFGHMVVAAVAYDHLTSTARANVDHLLQLNPLYAQWQSQVASLPAVQQNKAIFMLAATWPDLIKRDNNYHDDGPDPRGNTPPPSGGDINVGYSDMLRHKYWHFVDTPFTQDGTPLQPPPAVNALSEIHLMTDALGSAASEDIKSYDLVWLEHLVGDIHQPLHATSRFSTAFPNGDAGGNLEKLSCAGAPSPCPNELHAYWDDVLDTGNNDLPTAITFAHALPHATLTEAGQPDKWVADSFALSKLKVYSGTAVTTPSPHHLSPAYKTRAKTAARSQVNKAGLRLADLINSKLG